MEKKESTGKVKAWADMVWIYIVVYISITIAAAAIILVASIGYGIVIGIQHGGDAAYLTESIMGFSTSGIMLMTTQSIGEIIGIIVLLLIWRFYKRSKLKDIGLTKIHVASDGLKGFLLGIASIAFVYIVLIVTGQLRITSVSFSFEIIAWFFIFIIVGFYEEILSRGFAMSVLRPIKNKYFVIAVPAIIFSLLHGMNANVTYLGLFNIFLIGVLFAIMFIKRGSLWMPIGFHISWNFFQGNILGLNVSGLEMPSVLSNDIFGNTLLTGGSFGAEGGIITTILIIVEILIMYIFFDKKEGDGYCDVLYESHLK